LKNYFRKVWKFKNFEFVEKSISNINFFSCVIKVELLHYAQYVDTQGGCSKSLRSIFERGRYLFRCCTVLAEF